MGNNNNRGFIYKALAVALAIATACPYAYAADIGRVTYAGGRVDVVKAGAETAVPLNYGDTIGVGDAIRTKSGSKAEVTFADKSVVRLAQNTRIEVRDYIVDDSGKRKTADIMVERGKARTIIAKMPDKAEFNISTPNASGTVKGSDVVAFYQAGNSGMMVAEGLLSIAGAVKPEDRISVPAGSSVVVPMDGTPLAPRPFMPLEKKMHEDDTSIPDTVSRNPDAVTLKGAVSAVSGDVRITRRGESAGSKLTINDVVSEGDAVETGADGMVDIKLENGCGVTLKEKTSIVFTRLAIDPKTGQYDNQISVAIGKIRARVERLKETDSTFEVKTPTAICGARGTLMYVEVTSRGTRCFFEGGIGELKSAILNIHKSIEMGHSAFADNEGNVSDPLILNENERVGWTSGWEPGNGTEGYSAPGGSVGILLNSETGAVATFNIPLTQTDTQTFFSDPLFSIGGESGTDDGGTEDVVDEVVSTGLFNATTSYYDTWGNGLLEGVSEIAGALLWTGGEADMISAGSFTSDGYEPFIWFGEPGTDDLVSTDGAVLYGTTIGIGGGDILKGFAQLMFIDPDGDLGFASGEMPGLFSGPGSSYLFTGTLTGEKAVEDIGIAAEDFLDSIQDVALFSNGVYGGYEGDGYLRGDVYSLRRHYLEYSGGSAGIYDMQIWGSNNEYSNYDLSDAWSMDIGGVQESEGGNLYWMMNSSGDWGSNQMSGAVSGRSISPTMLGEISGYLYGVYDPIEGDEYGRWMAASAGRWTEKVLGWSAGVEADMVYYNGEYIDSFGYTNAIIGAIDSPLATAGSAVPVVLMGAGSGTNTWSGYIYGSLADDGSSIIDGFTTGSLSEITDAVKGLFAAIFMDVSGNAGTLTGSFEGAYYPDLEMWDGDGEATAVERGSYLADNYTDDYNYIDGYISGSFGEPGRQIYSDYGIRYMSSYGGYEDSASYTRWLVDISDPEYPVSADWGIFNIQMGGYYDDPDGGDNSWKITMSGNSWTSDGTGWFAAITGTSWADGILEGVLDGFSDMDEESVSVISGRAVGSYDTGGDSWQGVALGTYERKALSSRMDTSYEFAGHYFDGNDEMVYYDESVYASAAIGFVDSPLLAGGKAVHMYMSGESYDMGGSVWGYLNEDNYIDGSFIPEGYLGISVGRGYGDLCGAFAGLFVDTAGNAGTMTGYLDGGFDGEDGSFGGMGSVIARAMASGFTGEFGTDRNYMGGYLDGTFKGEDSYLYYDYNLNESSDGVFGSYTSWLVDAGGVPADWGIFNLELGGHHDGADDDAQWSIFLSGKDWSRVDEDWFGKIAGKRWSDGIMKGVMDGFYSITQTAIGLISGYVVGSYDVWGEGVWEAVALGAYELKSLLWSADTEYISSHYYEGEYQGVVSYNGGEGEDTCYALMGTIDSPFANLGKPVDMYLKGDIYTEAYYTSWGYIRGSYADESSVPEGFIGFSRSGQNDDVAGILASLYVDADGNAGTMYGTFDGNYFRPDEAYPGTFCGFGEITATERGSGYTGEYVTDYNYIDGYIKGSFGGNGYIDNYVYLGDGYYEDRSITNSSLGLLGSYSTWLVNYADYEDVNPENWGIFNIELGGRFEQMYMSDDWQLSLSGSSWREESSYWFASVDGSAWSGGLVTGSMRGVWFESAATEENPDAVRAGSIKGGLVGDYVEVEGESGTWTAISAGEWVEVTELLDQTLMFGANGLNELNNYVNVPVTEVYSNLLTAGSGACTGGITSAAMNINMYALDSYSLNGIWAALISGTYGTVAGPGWTANVTNNAGDDVVLTGTLWDTANNTWTADVAGTVGGNTITNGQAGGTFGDGSFTGVGAGTWEADGPK